MASAKVLVVVLCLALLFIARTEAFYLSSSFLLPPLLPTWRQQHAIIPHTTTPLVLRASTSSALQGPSNRGGSIPSFKVMDILKRANELSADGSSAPPVLHCEVGQPQTGAPSAVLDAAMRALQNDKLGYTDAMGIPALKNQIVRHYAKRYGGVKVDPARIIITTGSSAGFLLTFIGCFDIGACVAGSSSGYPCYKNLLQSFGCELVPVEVNSEFKLTAVELDACVAARRKQGLPPLSGLIISSPSNPTGAMLSPSELKALCASCDRHGIRFISDEIYHGITYPPHSAPPGTPAPTAPTALSYSTTAVVVNSFSKRYSMSGWRLGWLVVPDSLIPSVNSLQQNMFINAPTISQLAAVEAFNEGTEKELDANVENYAKARKLWLDCLTGLNGVTAVAPADGAFYIYVDISASVSGELDAVKLCERLLEDERVAVTPGTDFEFDENVGRRRFRISYAGGEAVARSAVERFLRFFERWRKLVDEDKKRVIRRTEK